MYVFKQPPNASAHLLHYLLPHPPPPFRLHCPTTYIHTCIYYIYVYVQLLSERGFIFGMQVLQHLLNMLDSCDFVSPVRVCACLCIYICLSISMCVCGCVSVG